MQNREKLNIVVVGGGSGSIPIEDGLLELTPNVIGITHPYDNGGDSKKIRDLKLGLCPPGDAIRRVAIRLRNPDLRRALIEKWHVEGSERNGHRPGNDLLAAFEFHAGSHSEGIRRLEHAFRADYQGQVIPVSDDDLHLRALLQNGDFIDFEDKIGERKTPDPEIVDLRFINRLGEIRWPRPNPEAIEAILSARQIVLAPTSLWTSSQPILKTPDISYAIYQSQAPLIWCSNAFTNLAETHNYNLADFAKIICGTIGKQIDLALVDSMPYDPPEAYNKEGSFRTVPKNTKEAMEDILECAPFVRSVVYAPFTQIYNIGGIETVRHSGKKVADHILQFTQESNSQLRMAS